MPRAAHTIFLLALGTLLTPLAHAQAHPEASQRVQLSTFAAATATETGLNSGRNVGLTAGLDLGFQPFHGLYPSLEARGTLPVDKGHVDSQKTLLGGVQLAYPVPRVPRIRAYGDVLFGRGSIDYGAGYEVRQTNVFYTISHGNVIAAGGGIDLKLSDHFALKLDAQVQRFSTPVTDSGHLYAATGNIGLVYRLHLPHPANEVLR